MFTHKCLATSAFFWVVATCTVARGQTSGGGTNEDAGLMEIVVTAQRRDENLQNVPITVTAINGSQLTASGVQTTQDLSFVVPGLSFPSTQGTALPHLRGVGNSAIEPGVENSVALYVDGVYYATAAGSILSLNNVAQVEVLKGPQGTLFGRNATGGLIQVTTRDPTQEFHGAADVTYGNYKTVQLNGYVTGGMDSNLAGDLAIQLSHQGDGYGNDYATGQQAYQLDTSISARSKLLWTPGDATSVRMSLDYEKTHIFSGFSEVPGTAGSNVFYGRTPQLITLPDYDVNESQQPVENERGGGASLHVTQDLGFAELVNIIAYRQSEFYFDVDADLGPEPLLEVTSNQADKQLSEEIQLQSVNSDKLRWTGGMYYFHATDLLTPLTTNLGGFAESPFGPGLSLTRITINSSQTTKSIAGYGQASYEFLPKTTLTLGARMTHEAKTFRWGFYRPHQRLF